MSDCRLNCDNKPIHIAFAFHDPSGLYAFFAAASARSVIKRSSSPIWLHILHDKTLTAYGRALLQNLADSEKTGICFHQVPALPAKLDLAMIPPNFGIGSFYRYCLPDLPEMVDIDRVIYLDCDICAMLDIAELWQTANVALDSTVDNKGAVLACVQNVTMDGNQAYLNKLGLNRKIYPNSGVLVMDLPRLRSRIPRMLTTITNVLARLPSTSLFPDQDALAGICMRLPVCMIDERYNFQIHIASRWTMTKEELEGKLVHYCGRKPWCTPSYTAAEPFLTHLRALDNLI